MNELKHLQQFQKLLSDYTISDHAKAVLAKLRLAVLLAPSSTGRNTIIRDLIQNGHYRFIVSDTTRKPRTNNGVLETNGTEYWFRTEEEMLEDIANGEMLEAEVIHEQQVSGVSIRELEKTVESNKIGITDMDLVGVQNVLRLKPDTHVFLVLPPSFDEWIKRLKGRGEISDTEFIRRLRTALRIFAYAPTEFRLKLVVNDDLKEAVTNVDQTIAGLRGAKPQRVVQKQELLADLIDQTKELLAKLDRQAGQITGTLDA
jgi:guanylate kinase